MLIQSVFLKLRLRVCFTFHCHEQHNSSSDNSIFRNWIISNFGNVTSDITQVSNKKPVLPFHNFIESKLGNGEFYLVQEHYATDSEAPKLWKSLLGTSDNHLKQLRGSRIVKCLARIQFVPKIWMLVSFKFRRCHALILFVHKAICCCDIFLFFIIRYFSFPCWFEIQIGLALLPAMHAYISNNYSDSCRVAVGSISLNI